MFKIVKAPRAWWPVRFKLPGEEGSLVEHEFELRFRLLKVDEAIAFIAKANDAEASEVGAPGTDPAAKPMAEIYAELVEEVADDWRGVQAENGDALPWSHANLVMLMNEQGMFMRIFDAFRDCLAGRDRLRAGN